MAIRGCGGMTRPDRPSLFSPLADPYDARQQAFFAAKTPVQGTRL